MFVAAQVVKAYKKLKDFENDATEARADAFVIGFTDCRNKVAQISRS